MLSLPPVLISQDRIATRVAELGLQISEDYRDVNGDNDLVLVGILKGSFIFLADLARELTIPRKIEFMAVQSYGSGNSSGAVRMLMDVRDDIKERHVLIVEDIVDTGRTLKYLINVLGSRGPASVKTCALLHKADAMVEDVPLDYIGFGIENEWVVGYGLDYAEQHRTLPYIGVVKPDDR